MLDIAALEFSKGVIHPSIYADHDVYEQELEKVFGQCWLFLAHDDMLPKKGSFLQTYMGADPVMVVRQRDGSVKAWLNQCRHRGMRICRSDEGLAKTFTCSYHGWAYDLAGNLINVPSEERAYRGHLDKSRWGALAVPRVATYKGLIFGTWSDDVPELEEYLGDMTFYLDAWLDRFDGGIELVPNPVKWVIDCNWKFSAEQFASDIYHAPISHSSAMVALYDDPALQSIFGQVMSGPGRQFGQNGHGSGSFWLQEFGPDVQAGPVYSEWQTANREDIYSRIGEETAHKVWSHNTVFPNFSFLIQSYTLRVWHPRGPGQIEVWAWAYMPRNAPDHVKTAIRKSTQYTFSSAGVFETDDGENWTEVQLVLQGWKARQNTFNASMGMGYEEYDAHGLPGRSGDVISETAARGFYTRWQDLMLGRSWSEIAELDARRVEAEKAATAAQAEQDAKDAKDAKDEVQTA